MAPTGIGIFPIENDKNPIFETTLPNRLYLPQLQWPVFKNR